MTKRINILMTALVAFAAQSVAQCIDITLKDNTGVTYNVNDIKSIDFFEDGPEGSLSGRWYLGYRDNTAYAGKENVVFRGSQMIWTTSSSSKTYDLEYSEDGISFKATEVGKTTATTHYILEYNSNLLILKRGSYYYYFYPSVAEAANTKKTDMPAHTPSANAETIIKNYGSGRSNNASNPMGNHIANRAHKATAEEIAWLEDPKQNPPKMCGFTNWVTKTISLYPTSSPKPADVNQHAIGDCCFCAVMASLAYNAPDFIKNIITKESSTVYAVKLYDPYGEPITVRVNTQVLCGNDGGVAQVTGKNNAITWATLLEKAVMKWETVFKCNSSNGDDLGGIGTENVAPIITGNGNSFAIDRRKLLPQEMKKVVEWAVENGHVSIGGFGVGDLLCGTEKTVTGHAFTLMLTSYPDEYMWTMRNPWGQSSTSKKVDGQLEIPNDWEIIKVIDFRIVEPGASAAFLRSDRGPYTPPSYIRRTSDLGVSEEILRQCGVTRFVDYCDDEAPLPPSFVDDEE